jgi:hypothetical protein
MSRRRRCSKNGSHSSWEVQAGVLTPLRNIPFVRRALRLRNSSVNCTLADRRHHLTGIHWEPLFIARI